MPCAFLWYPSNLWLVKLVHVCMHAVLGPIWATCSDNIGHACNSYCSVYFSLAPRFCIIVLQDVLKKLAIVLKSRRLLWGKLTCQHCSVALNTTHQGCHCCEPLNLEQSLLCKYNITLASGPLPLLQRACNTETVANAMQHAEDFVLERVLV